MAKQIVRQLISQFRIDTTQFHEQLQTIKSGLSRTGAEINALKQHLRLEWDSDKYNRAMALAAERTQLAADRVKLLKNTMAEMEAQGVDKTAEGWREMEKDLARAETAAVKARKEFEEIAKISYERVSKELEKVGDNLESIGKKASIASAAVSAGLAFSIKAAVDMEDAMAGVSKTTQLTGDALLEMRDELIGLSREIPIAAKELAGMVETAGQLGVANENVIDFSKTIAELGTVTNLAGQEGATSFARFANITQMAYEDVDRLGAAVFDLDRSTATTARGIMDMATRLASAGAQAGMTEADIVGLSAGLSSLGLEAQMGGTAFSKAINQITIAVETGSGKLDDFARVAGMTAEQFKTAWQTNAASALVSFTEGLANTDRLGQSTILTMQELGLTEIRMSDALRRAANSGDLMRNAIEKSNRAWEEGNALTDAAAIKFETTASKLQLAKNEVTALGIQLGDNLLPIVTDVARNVGEFAQKLADLDERTGGLVTQIGLFIAIFGPMTSILGKAIGSTAELIAKIGAWIVANKAAKVSQDALNASVATTPWGAIGTAIGLVVSAVSAAVVSYNLLKKETEETTAALKDQVNILKEQREAFDAIKEQFGQRRESIEAEANASFMLLERVEKLVEVEGKTAEQKRELTTLVKMLNDANQDLNLTYDEQTGILSANIASIENQIRAKREMDKIDAKREESVAILNQIAEAEEKLKGIDERRKEAKTELGRLEEEDRRIRLETGRQITQQSAVATSQRLDEMRRLSRAIDDLDAEEEDLRETIAAQNVEFDNNVKSIADASIEINKLAGSTRVAKEESEQLNLTLEDQQKIISDSTKAYEDLTGVLDRLAKGQDLSLSQIRRLIEQYPQLATHIKATATGYTIAEEAVRAMAQAELDAQIAIERAALARAEAVQREAQKVLDARTAMIRGINEQIEAEWRISAATGEAQREMRAGMEATIKMLEGLRAQLDRPITVTTPKTASGAAAGAATRAEQVKAERSEIVKEERVTQEDVEKARLELYRKGLADAKYERAVSDRERAEADRDYYTALRRLRDEYLTENSAEWRAATQELVKYYGSLKAANEELMEEDLQTYREKLAEAAYERDLQLDDSLEAQARFYEQMRELRDAYLKEDSETWKEATLNIMRYDKARADQAAARESAAQEAALEDAKALEEAARKAAEDAERYRVSAYNARREQLRYERDMDIIDDERYYAQLRRLQQGYLHESEEEWRRVNVEIYQFEKRMQQERLKEEEKFLQDKRAAEQRAVREAYDERAKQIRAELSLEKDRLNQLIRNIDEELAARRRLGEEESFEKRIAALQMQIEYERNTENRIALEKELLRVEKERDEYQFRMQREDEKTALRAQMTAAEELAAAQIANAERTRDELLKQYDEIYNVMLEQLTGKPREAPLQAAADAYAAAAKALSSVTSSVQTVNDNRQYTAPITIANAWTEQMIAALVRNTLEQMLV
ncbi:MAG: phage tail tape measure protein [Oscillospiraceae bacterium]|nr:phage tail tape measure protein [Oscillospiraceae bacterium]